MNSLRPQTNYYKYLDGYRLIAVSLVIVYHWLPVYFDKYPIAQIGVDMFFVLSGFLITEILIRQKKEFNKTEIATGKSLFFFYIRRALRIFPIYYAAILFFFCIGAPVVRENIQYFVFYAVNILVIRQGNWLGMFGHLWSLAIEEQFYLVWPVIILTIPFRYLGKVIGLLFLLSLAHIFFFSSGFSNFTILSCMSTLSSGAFLAFLKAKRSQIYNLKQLYVWSLIFLFVLLGLFTVRIIINSFLLHLIIILFSVTLIKVLITSDSNLLDKTFGNKIISFLGKISYGLYLYHLFIPWLLRNFNGTEDELVIIKRPFLPASGNGAIIIFSQLVLLVIVSVISWYIIEKPINSLKKYFDYKKFSNAG